jgi:hypothetical protein
LRSGLFNRSLSFFDGRFNGSFFGYGFLNRSFFNSRCCFRCLMNRARLYAVLLVEKFDNLRTQNVLVVAEITGEFLRQVSFTIEGDIHVVSLSLVVDGISKTALAPILDLDDFTVIGGDDAVELFDELLAGGFLDSGIDDIDDLVFVHDAFSPPFGLLALQHHSCRARMCRFIIVSPRNGFCKLFLKEFSGFVDVQGELLYNPTDPSQGGIFLL